MGNKLLDPNWGDDSKSYTPEELAEHKAKFKRRDRMIILIVIVLGLVFAAVVNQLAYYAYPHRDCKQIGEHTCVDAEGRQ